MTRIHDRIRTILETTPGLTQKGLAERMGLNPAAVNRMLYGRRNIMAEEIPVIENYIGQMLDISSTEKPAQKTSRQNNNAAEVMSPVPVMRQGKIVDWVPRHPAQAGIENAFAIYVGCDVMQPRYFRGELAYIHPGRPAEAGRDCLIEMKDKEDETVVRRIIRVTTDRVRVQQFNPPGEKDILTAKISAIYAVVGRG